MGQNPRMLSRLPINAPVKWAFCQHQECRPVNGRHVDRPVASSGKPPRNGLFRLSRTVNVTAQDGWPDTPDGSAAWRREPPPSRRFSARPGDRRRPLPVAAVTIRVVSRARKSITRTSRSSAPPRGRNRVMPRPWAPDRLRRSTHPQRLRSRTCKTREARLVPKQASLSQIQLCLVPSRAIVMPWT